MKTFTKRDVKFRTIACSRKQKDGFTFVEMLLVTLMVPVVAIALYAMLANGIKVWQLVNRESPQIDMNLFFERISEDLKNSFNYKTIKFVGTDISCTFPTLLKVHQRENGFKQVVGQVSYFYDADTKTLNRQAVDYQQLHSMKKPAARYLMENLESCSFKYYFYDDRKESFFWLNDWPVKELKIQEATLPLAVKIELVFAEGGNIEKRTKTVRIPIGGR